MKTVYASLGFALGTSAALLPRDQCCFSLTAAGGESGSVGQLGDGQNRVGQNGGLATGSATYCLSNGGLTDQNGRGCILTPPTTQFQCDSGATPTTGFSVNSNGDLEYNGSTTFYACDTGDNGGQNIYTTTSSAQTGCEKITLNTGGKCAGAGNGGAASGSASKPASSAPASSAPASSAPAPSAPASSAPAPAPSAPASSAPASPVGPAGGSTVTVMSTHYVTVTSCPAEVSCPATGSAPAPSAPAGSAPASPVNSQPAGSAPAPSAPASSAPAPSAPASSAPANSQPASSAPSAPASSAPAASATNGNGNGNGNNNGACPTTLGGAYQTPHAIIPVNKDQPSKSYGTQYNASISSSESTIFNFDIPQSYSGKQCSVIFLFPEQSQLETSSFTASGSGGLKFDQLTSAAPMDVTYASAPKSAKTLDEIDSVMPGNSYVVSTGACAAGTTESIEVSSVGGYSLEFFEDWNPSPIGLFITSC